jgi:hypothetical protein
MGMPEPLFRGVGVALATLFDDVGELDAKATAGWDPLAHLLQPRRNGTRSAAVTLPPGRRFAFRYLAEGGRAVRGRHRQQRPGGGGHRQHQHPRGPPSNPRQIGAGRAPPPAT